MIARPSDLPPYGVENTVEFWRTLCAQMEERATDAESAVAHMSKVTTVLLLCFVLMTAAAVIGWIKATGG